MGYSTTMNYGYLLKPLKTFVVKTSNSVLATEAERDVFTTLFLEYFRMSLLLLC